MRQRLWVYARRHAQNHASAAGTDDDCVLLFFHVVGLSAECPARLALTPQESIANTKKKCFSLYMTFFVPSPLAELHLLEKILFSCSPILSLSLSHCFIDPKILGPLFVDRFAISVDRCQ
jgi:hypothetical protein